MDNREIAKQFDLLAKLLELHGENPFKVRSYSTAYQVLRKADVSLQTLDEAGLMEMKGIGKAVANKILEYNETGQIQALEQVKQKTPEGLIELLGMKGIGPKKLAVLWKELGVTSSGELEYACMENRLLTLKGFGKKTQESILAQIEFLKQNRGQALLSAGLNTGEQLLDVLRTKFPGARCELTGELRRKMDRIGRIDLIGTANKEEVLNEFKQLNGFEEAGSQWKINGLTVHYEMATSPDFGTRWFRSTGPEEFIQTFDLVEVENESELFEQNKKDFVIPELRDLVAESELNIEGGIIEQTDIKGVIHTHSTWSDGVNSIQQMVDACKLEGYKYLVMTDHSQSAFYANGLTEDRLYQQWEEIEAVNRDNDDFRVFKGIESDILNDGNLDYQDELISRFEVVIASVHSNLKMDAEKANQRLLKAIEHPATQILGHMTGRLLLSRPGYPVDHALIIDACAANQVAIEINANPHRLDIDWRWLPYALEKGVKISISPDAHNTRGIGDIKYGVWMGRKGGLPASACLNVLDTPGFDKWARSKRK